MDKIYFINSPGQTTPLNATNLNQLQTNVENGILDSSVTEYGDGSIDPNTTLYPLILTRHANAPQGQGTFFYIITKFFNSISTTSSRTQIAYGYTTDVQYQRHYYNGSWGEWVKTSEPTIITNANGTAVKFPNGTMICYLNTTVTNQAINSAYGESGLYTGYYDWTFPEQFISQPTVTCGSFLWGTSASWGGVRSSTTQLARLYGYDYYSRSTGTNCHISAMAVGLWK